MADFIVSGGYSALYERDKNRIVIGLPQTVRTLTNTVQDLEPRKVDLTTEDLALLLQMARYICNRRGR